MANEKKEPPKSAEELLERYAAGERDFRGAELIGENMGGAILARVNLGGALLRDANLHGVDFRYANLKRALLIGANLQRADLRSSNLNQSDLEETFLQGANLQMAFFEGANLIGANLEAADLELAHFAGAVLRRANLRGANLRFADLLGADLQDTNLIGTNFQEANLQRAIFQRANFTGANLQGASLRTSDFRYLDLQTLNLDGLDITNAAFVSDANLLTANWQTLRFGDKTYHRDAVERGEEILPAGMGPHLAVLIETARLRGAKTEAASAVVDYLASAGIQAEVANAGGAGSTIKLSVRSRDDAEILLQAGDGVCRLLGLGSGVENLLPSNSTLSDQVTEAIAPLLDERFDLASRQSHLETDQLLSTLETIGREDVRSIKLAGFTDAQMEALKNLAELGSEYLEVKVDEENKEAWMTPGQQVARDVYESQVAKPLRTIISAVFQSLTEKPGDG